MLRSRAEAEFDLSARKPAEKAESRSYSSSMCVESHRPSERRSTGVRFAQG